MNAISLLTRGRISGSDARALLASGYIYNAPQPPTVSQDFCPVVVRVSDASSIGRVRVAHTGVTVRILPQATIIRKKC